MAQARYGTINSIYAVERRSSFIASFLSNDPSEFSFTDLRSPITSSRGTATILRLSQKKLAWGEKNPNSSERSTAAMVPYGSADLEFVREMFTEARHPCVLLCVIRTSNKPRFRYEILAFRLQSEQDVQLFINLFITLTHHQTPDVGRVQSRAATVNRDEPSYISPAWNRTRPTSAKLDKSWTSPPRIMPSVMSPTSLVDGEVFRVVGGTPRRTQLLHNTADSLRPSRDRHHESRASDVQPRSVIFAAARPGHSSVRRSDTEELRRSTDRTIVIRDVGVTADLDSWTPRSRPGDYLPVEGSLSSHHDRIYVDDEGAHVGDVFCQTNLRSPSKTAWHGNGNSSFVWNDSQSDNTARSRKESKTGFGHKTVSRVLNDRTDETDSTDDREQSIPRHRPQRRMTLVDNGIVKVTVEEYQDPAESTAEEQSPGVQSSNQTTTESDQNYDHRQNSRNRVNRVHSFSGGLGRPLRADSIDGDRHRQRISGAASPPLIRSPAMTSSVHRVFSRPSGPKLSLETDQHVIHPVEFRQTQTRRRSSHRDDRGYPVERPYTSHEAAVHQSRPVANRNEPMSYPAHRPYSMNQPAHQSEPIIMRVEPAYSEKKRHPIKTSFDTHESVYQSQPINIRAEPTSYPTRHRTTTHESVHKSRPIVIRQKSLHSDYGNEMFDVYREPRHEYRLVAGTSGPVTISPSKRSTIYKLEQRTVQR